MKRNINMKRIAIYFFALLLVLCSASCEKMRYQGHFLDEAKKIDSIGLFNYGEANLVYQGHKDGGVAYFAVGLYPRLCEPGEQEEMWSYYNDNGYYGKHQTGVKYYYRNDYVGSFYIYDCRFVSIDITALDAFNQHHPENSSLNDICWYSFPNHRTKQWIAGGYKGNIPASSDCDVNIGRVTSVKPDDMELFNAQGKYGYIPFKFYLDELPDASSVRIRIDIKDALGHTFTTEGILHK